MRPLVSILLLLVLFVLLPDAGIGGNLASNPAPVSEGNASPTEPVQASDSVLFPLESNQAAGSIPTESAILLEPPAPPEPEIENPELQPGEEEKSGLCRFEIETLREWTPRMRSILARKIEIWWRDRMIATLGDGDEGVSNAFHRRIFKFQNLRFPKGYHFVTIRAYAEGFISRDMKWKGRTLQIGIHPEKPSLVKIKFPLHVW